MMEFGQDLNLIRKDKRGVSGVDKTKLINIGKKISEIPQDFNVHKTLKKYLI